MRTDKVEHDFLFFKEYGEPLRNLLYPGHRLRRTLGKLRNIRYRQPYTARHTSVSWDLMIGRSALWVARQHGHSITTMLRFYSAWAGKAPESGVDAIRSAMNSEKPRRQSQTLPDRISGQQSVVPF